MMIYTHSEFGYIFYMIFKKNDWEKDKIIITFEHVRRRFL